jgi:hypothetical protein
LGGETQVKRSGFERFIAIWCVVAIAAFILVVFDVHAWFYPASRQPQLEGWAAPAAGAFMGSVCLALYGLAMHRKARG